MRAALNATSLLAPLSGVGRYTAMLGRELLAAGVECRFFYGTRWSAELEPAKPGFSSWRRLRGLLPGARLLERRVLQRAFERGGGAFDLYHEPSHFPLAARAPTVTTFHDLSPLRFPETHTADARRLWERNLPAALERSRLIIAVSEFTRQEILRVLHVAPAKVVAIPNGVAPHYRPLPAPEIAPVIAPLGLAPGRYCLSVGTLEPRKNLVAALDAWRALPEPLARTYPLAVAGAEGWMSRPIHEKLGAGAGRVRYLGHVDDERMVALYAGAALLLYPSLYEGFGLPPLEAMACGTPVVVSNRASLPEVVGEAGVQLEPADVDAIVAAVRRLLEDAAERRRRSDAGVVQAARFTWRRTAELTLGAYRAALA